MCYKGIQRLLLVLLVFLSCFSLNFFLLLLFSCLCTGMLRMFFLYFPFFSFFFLFVLFFFLHAFFLLRSIRENWSNFFLLLLFSCLCTGMLRIFFLYFPFFFFFFLFVLFFFLHAFFLLRSIRENWSKINIVWIDIMHIWVKEFVVRLMMLLLFLCKALILGKI